ncbi:hypothetical protein GJAV_G00152940 [Gymnothorax javanicus]|nr:hypothetical protein GJAV_G00152940 [Gymnothorax javanicus]
MNSAVFQASVRPNLPLRRPATSLGTTPKIITPPFGEKKSCLPAGGPTPGAVTGDAAKMDSSRKDNGRLLAGDSPSKSWSEAGFPMVAKLCNFCSQQGNFRCTRCKKTFYCSVACQTEDWKAHRHVCRPSTQESAARVPDFIVQQQTHGGVSLTSPAVPGLKTPEPMVRASPIAQVKRVYLHELPKNKTTKGAQLQVSLLELRNPGKFFVRVQTAEQMEQLHSVTMALQKSCQGSLHLEYLPDYGELCAVKYSHDQNWYRGAVLLADAGRKAANILYIDFGNQEEVTLDRIMPLPASVDLAPPSAVECRVAGLSPAAGSWTEECCIASRQLLTGKTLPLTVMDVPENTNVWAVDIMLPAVGKKLSEFLLKQGYAVEESSGPLEPSDQDIDSILSAALENYKRSSGGRQDLAGILPPEPLTQGLGDSFSAMVTHVQTPSELICQKVDNASVIQEMQLKLREYCSQTAASEDFRPAPGSVCCSQFTEDRQWYRATVLGYSSETRVCVGYIDFGNSEEVDLSHLRPITAELATLPMQAIPCVLADVKPVSGKWSDEAILLLKKSVCNKFVRVEIVGERQSAALVVLTDQYSDPPTSVNELLLTSGHALPDDTAPSRGVGQAPSSPSTAAIPPTTPNQLSSNSLSGNSTPLPTGNAKTLEEPSALVSISSSLEWSCAELPCDGQSVDLAVSMIQDPGEFYCHRCDPEDMHALKELSGQILEHCRSQNSPFTPIAGEPCFAVFPGDGSWYRAMVLDLAPDKKATVYFVDYGNTSEVELTHMQAIPAQFLKLPFQAIRCWLAGAEPLKGSWEADAVRQFQVLMVGRKLQAQVCSITERGFGVELLADGQSIAALLVAEGLAEASSQNSPTVAPHSPPGNTGGTFPVDWKTVELLRNKPFQPRVAAVVSPSLFYIMREDNKGDKSWYRAVVLQVTGGEAEIVCADYGNVVKVPLSSVVPIDEHHLLLPFQIARCALSGKELFPAEWTESVLEMFKSQLRGAAHATVDRFDGTFNLLVLALTDARTLRATKGSGALPLSSPKDAGTTAPASLSPTSKKPAPDVKFEAAKMTAARPLTAEIKSTDQSQQITKSAAPGGILSSTDVKCCCSHLIQKIDRLEELIMLLVNQLGTPLPKS